MKLLKSAILSATIALSLPAVAHADIDSIDRTLERGINRLIDSATRELTRDNYPRRERSTYGVDDEEMDDYRKILRICSRQRNNPDFYNVCKELTR